MAVARIHKTKDYTVMSNSHFREKDMSLKAKGLLSLMLSLPDDWDYTIAGLATLSKDGKDSIMNALNELEHFGYLKRTRIQNKHGQFAGYDYDIFEEPQKDAEETPATDTPPAEKPYAENPNAENPPQINTNKLITNKTNTNKLNTKEYKEIIDFLNDKAGTKFKPTTKATRQHINARFEEGFTLENFKTVIQKKCDEWVGTEFAQYLRPQTLFGAKFEGYLNAPGRKSNKARPPQEVDEELADIFA